MQQFYQLHSFLDWKILLKITHVLVTSWLDNTMCSIWDYSLGAFTSCNWLRLKWHLQFWAHQSISLIHKLYQLPKCSLLFNLRFCLSSLNSAWQKSRLYCGIACHQLSLSIPPCKVGILQACETVSSIAVVPKLSGSVAAVGQHLHKQSLHAWMPLVQPGPPRATDRCRSIDQGLRSLLYRKYDFSVGTPAQWNNSPDIWLALILLAFPKALKNWHLFQALRPRYQLNSLYVVMNCEVCNILQATVALYYCFIVNTVYNNF